MKGALGSESISMMVDPAAPVILYEEGSVIVIFFEWPLIVIGSDMSDILVLLLRLRVKLLVELLLQPLNIRSRQIAVESLGAKSLIET